MKTLNPTTILFAFILLFTGKSNAQCTYPASGSEYPSCYNSCAGVNDNSNTGNDTKFKISGGHTCGTLTYPGEPYLSVYVWDDQTDNTPGLGWDDGAGNLGTVALQFDDAEDPDVVLQYVNNDPNSGGNSWYALVTYFTSKGGGYYLDVYQWNGTDFTTLFNSTQFQSATSFGTTVNIDADSCGHFGIVWDDVVNSDIEYALGTDISFCFPFSIGSISGTSNYKEPDIAFYTDACTGSFYVSALETPARRLKVFASSWSSCSSVPSFSNVYTGTVGVGETLSFPRIACPPEGKGWGTDFCVVAAYRHGTRTDIVSFTSYNGSVIPYLYTLSSGTTGIFTDCGPCNMPAGTHNAKPAVSYKNNYPETYSLGSTVFQPTWPGIMIGWTTDYSDPNMNGTSCVGLQVDLTGLNVASVCGNYYLVVPTVNSASSTGDQENISISGREYWYALYNYFLCSYPTLGSSFMFYTYWDDFTPDILYKWGDFDATSCPILRQQESGTDDFSFVVSPNPSNGTSLIVIASPKPGVIYRLSIINDFGQEMVTFEGQSSEVERNYKAWSDQSEPGFYLLELSQGNNKIIRKLVKT